MFKGQFSDCQTIFPAIAVALTVSPFSSDKNTISASEPTDSLPFLSSFNTIAGWRLAASRAAGIPQAMDSRIKIHVVKVYLSVNDLPVALKNSLTHPSIFATLINKKRNYKLST